MSLSGSARRQVFVVEAALAVTGSLRAAAHMAEIMAPWIDVILVLPKRSRIDPQELRHFRQVIRLPIRQIRRAPDDLFLYVPALILTAARLRRALRAPGSALFINDFYLMHGAVLRWLGFSGLIVTWVRIDPNKFPRRLADFWLGRAYAVSDRIVAVSDHIRALLPASPKVVRIYDPVPPSAPDPSLPAEGEEAKIVCVANYTRGKGQEHAIAAFALIAADFPGAQLHFYGGDLGIARNQRFRAELEQQARRAGVGDRVHFHAFVEDVGAVLDGAALALNLSESESFSFTCLEASLSARPVIATRSGGPEEIVVDGVTGCLVARGDVRAVAGAMARLLRDRDRAAEMGQAGAAHVRARFSSETFRRSILELLDHAPDETDRTNSIKRGA